MSTIDSRIVTMKFDNTAFQKGVTSTMDALSKLKTSLNFSSATSAATKSLSGISGVLGKFGVTNPFAKTTQGAADLTTATTNTSKGLGVVSSVLGKFGLSNPFAKTTTGATDLNTATGTASKGLGVVSSVLGKFGLSNPFAKTTTGATDLNTATGTATKGLGVVSSVLGKFGLSNPFSKTTQGATDLNTATGTATKGLGGISGVLSKFSLSNPFSKTTQGATDLNTASGNASKGLGGISSVLGKFVTSNPFYKTTEGMSDLQSSTRGFSLSPITDGISGVSAGFVAMSTVAITAISNITNKAVNAGLELAKSLTIDPVSSGFSEYETNLNSIQTILANTGLEGQKGLDTVTGALDELNAYSDKTIYNFSEMARNIGTFTAAGVDLDTATGAIKGIANLAAVSGSNSQQASTAMYQLSQALAAGKVTLMDWNSVVNAGMGGKLFQESLMETARVHGVAIDDMVKDAGSFRSTLEQGWLTDEVLTETLSKFNGDLNEAQLKNMGYNAQQIKDIIKLGDMATDAATKVKTASALISTLQETVGSGWSKSFQFILGDFGEAKELFTNANNVLGGMLADSAKARNKVLKDWNEMGGRDMAIEAISNAFQALLNILTPIKDAFRDIFPAMTGKGLFELTVMIRDFTEGLIASKGTMENIQSIFRALFAVLGVGVDIVQGLIQYFIIDFIQLLSGGTGGVLDFTGSIADLVTSLALWLREGDKIGKFFAFFSATRAAFLGPIIKAFGGLLSILGGFVTTGAEAVFGALVVLFKALQPTIEVVRESLKLAGDVVQGALLSGFKALQPVLENVGEALKTAGGVVQNTLLAAFKALPEILITVRDALASASSVVRDSLIAAFVDLRPVLDGVRNAFSAAFEALPGILANVKAAIADAFGSLSGVGGAIGGAVGGLAGIFNIGGATEEAKKGINEVQSALSFMTPAASAAKNEISGFAGFLQSLVVFLAKVGGGIGFLLVKIVEGNAVLLKQMFSDISSAWPNISAFFGELKDRIIGYFSNLGFDEGLALVNTGFFIALYAMFARFTHSLGGLVKAFTGTMKSVTGVLDQVTSNLKTMQADVRANIILKIASALAILAVSLYILSGIDAKALGIALGALSALLVELVAALAVLEKTSSMGGSLKLAALSLALIGLGVGLLAMSVALAILGRMNTGEIVKGLASMAAILAVIIAATAILGKTGGAVQIIIAAAAIGVLALSLTMFAGALKLYAALDTAMMAEGGLKVALGLVAIGIAMRTFPPNMLVTAAGLYVVASALIVLAGALKIIASMSGGDTFQAIITLNLVLPLLAATIAGMSNSIVGAAALVVVAGALIVLGTALALIGNLGIDTIVIALVAIAVALDMLAVAGGLLTPVAPVLLAVGYAILLLGVAALAAGAGLLLFSAGLAALAVTGAAGFAVLISIIQSFLMLLPLIAQQFGLALVAFASVIAKAGPPMVQAISAILKSILQAFIDLAPKIGETVRVWLAELFSTLRSAVPDMIKTGYLIVVAFLKGLSSNIRAIASLAVNIIAEFLRGISQNISKLIVAGATLIVKFLEGISKSIGKVITAATTLIAKFLDGIAKNIGKVVTSGVNLVSKFLDGVAKNIGKLITAGVNVVAKFLDGIAKNIGKLVTAGVNVILKFLQGIANNINKVISAGVNIIIRFLQGIANNLNKVISAGVDIVIKFVQGIANNINKVINTGADIIVKFLNGLARNIKRILDAGANVVITFLRGISNNVTKIINMGSDVIVKFLNGLARNIKDIVDAGVNLVIKFLQGIADNTEKIVKAGVGILASVVKGILQAVRDIGGDMLQAGWDVAKGLVEGIVDGIVNMAGDIKGALNQIASDAWEGVKGFFSFGSPSKLMMWAGEMIVQGLGIGIRKNSYVASDEALDMATGVMNTMRDTMSGISDIIASDLDMSPVIAPVLDLTQVQQDANKMGSILASQPITAGVSFDQASSISAEQLAAAEAVFGAAPSEAAPITFEQNNYSPKALSAIEVYRQTRNQLSLAKEALQ